MGLVGPQRTPPCGSAGQVPFFSRESGRDFSSAPWRFLVTKPKVWLITLLLAIAPIATAQTLNTLVSFDGTDGAFPIAALVQGQDGNFYGTAGSTVFRVGPKGKLTTLYNFCSKPNCSDGSTAIAPLVLA